MLGGKRVSTVEVVSLAAALIKFNASQMAEPFVSWWNGGIERRGGRKRWYVGSGSCGRRKRWVWARV